MFQTVVNVFKNEKEIGKICRICRIQGDLMGVLFAYLILICINKHKICICFPTIPSCPLFC